MQKRNTAIYWVATAWLALGMLSTGLVQLLHLAQEDDFATALGYPVYFLTLLGAWKILGVAALLLPRWPRLKEWAYAGFFFTTTGAIFSHLAAHAPVTAALPALLLLALTVASWYFRPASRRLLPLTQ
ncbi:DoxX family protein [Hymenobacter gummosus]|uniref:DoxX family protein n=1 Tax=Hymenobacter gummosus TaxID=1776032 RepID=A0A3S0JCJ8_9BACT|nr:DoxX family protein [Hymenobacter gummosus]RTQ47820.1 DoxX family protein [Hymenobacter gummosus]